MNPKSDREISQVQPSAPPMTNYDIPPTYTTSVPSYPPSRNYTDPPTVYNTPPINTDTAPYPLNQPPYSQNPISIPPIPSIQIPTQRFCGKCGTTITSAENSFCTSCSVSYSSENKQISQPSKTLKKQKKEKLSKKEKKRRKKEKKRAKKRRKCELIGMTVLMGLAICLLFIGILLATVPKKSSTPWYSPVFCPANNGYYVSYNPIGQNCPSYLFQNESQSENFYISQLASKAIYSLEIAYDTSIINNVFIEIDVSTNTGANYMTAFIVHSHFLGVSTSTLQSGTTISLIRNGPSFGVFPTNCSEPCQFTLPSTLTTASFRSDTFDTASFLSSDYPITFSVAQGSYFSGSFGNFFLFRFNTGPSQGIVAGYVILFVFGSLIFCGAFIWGISILVRTIQSKLH